MASKKTPSSAVKNAAATTVSATPVSASPAITNEIKFGMQLDLSLNKNDLVNLAVSESEERLIMEREDNETKLRNLTKDHTRAVEQLDKLAEAKLVTYHHDADTAELLRLLQVKTGNTYVVKIVNTKASDYSYAYEKNKENQSPDVDVKKQAIVGSARVYQRRGDESYGNTAVVSWEVSINFDQPMKDAVEAIRDKADQAQAVKDQLAQINRMIYDLPRMKNRALRELTLSIARGEVKTMKDATDVVMGVKSRSLPEVAMLALPDGSNGGVTVNASTSVTVNNED